MKTQLSEPFLDSAQGQRAERILRSCVHCGFCNATCPTYQLLGDELDGPRGRIYQIKQVLEGQEPTPSLHTHLDRCLTCRACETTCPSGVDYHSLLDIGRELAAEKLPRPWRQTLLRRVLVGAFSEPRRAALIFAAARLVRPLLPAAFKRKIPLAGKPRAGPPSVAGTRRMLLLDGCVQPAAAPQINAAAREVFATLGITLESVAEAGCCGALQHHLGDTEGGREKARRNIDAWWPAIDEGAQAIVITASGCAPMVKDYVTLLADDRDYAGRAQRVSELARDVSEVLADEDLSALKSPRTRRIAFHSPCSLQHGQKLDGTVEALLRTLGYDLVTVKDPHLCCGSAGTYSILQPELSERLRDQKLAALEHDQPELIASANIGCLLHLQQGTQRTVIHWLELLADNRTA